MGTRVAWATRPPATERSVTGEGELVDQLTDTSRADGTEEGKDCGVAVVGVVFNDSVAAASAFSRHYGSLYPSVVDPGGAIANRYGVTSPPTTFIINARGRVAATLLGAVSAAQLRSAVARVRA